MPLTYPLESIASSHMFSRRTSFGLAFWSCSCPRDEKTWLLVSRRSTSCYSLWTFLTCCRHFVCLNNQVCSWSLRFGRKSGMFVLYWRRGECCQITHKWNCEAQCKEKVDIVLTPCGAYVVDILHSKSAESAAVIKWVTRLWLSGSGFSSFPQCFPISCFIPRNCGNITISRRLGSRRYEYYISSVIMFGFSVSRLLFPMREKLELDGFGSVLWITILFGDSMRSWINIGYSV